MTKPLKKSAGTDPFELAMAVNSLAESFKTEVKRLVDKAYERGVKRGREEV